MDDKKEKCCICGKEIKGWGNNPYPVKTEGEYCRECNFSVVLPERVRLSKQEQYEQGKTDNRN